MLRAPTLALALILPLGAWADAPPEGQVYALTAIDGAPFSARATLVLGPDGQLGGEAPCNTWFADWSGPWPAFAPGPIGATRMACQDLGLEAQFFDALSAMTAGEVTEGGLRLTGPEGRSMDFTPAP